MECTHSLARFPLLLCALMAAGAASQIAAPGAARSIICTEAVLLAYLDHAPDART